MRPAVRYVLAVVAGLVTAAAGAGMIYAGEEAIFELGYDVAFQPDPTLLNGPMPFANNPETDPYHYLVLLAPLLAASLTAAARVLSSKPFRRSIRSWWLGFAAVTFLLGALYLSPNDEQYPWKLSLGMNLCVIAIGAGLAFALGRARADTAAARWMTTVAAGITLFTPVLMQTLFTAQWVIWASGLMDPPLGWLSMTLVSAVASILAARAWHRGREAPAAPEAPALETVPAAG